MNYVIGTKMLTVLDLQLKRLRELAALIIESDATETLPSDGIGGATSGSDASAAASTGAGDSSISDIKQNIDQVILKYVKEVNTKLEDLTWVLMFY